ncbi:restriction endonuclease subunit S [Shewanella sp. SM73]|uniref:restriction endonuclease subunit S n=1 Tax=Shewanella TaxID=22 RepID=UPI0021D7E2D0|nr:restriction endonuclease subunit S [Shewanella sp. SM73]MCU8028171.1 restriction endonuclease subunit S [Shewanella sp. SM73]
MIGRYKAYPEYKESGVDWLGEVPRHWNKIKFKWILKEKTKTSNPLLPAGSISFGEVVYKNEDNLSPETKFSYQEVLKDELLINPLNLNFDLKSLRTGLSKINVVVSTGYIVIHVSESLDKNYIRWVMHQFDVAHMKTLGAGVRQTINFTDIANSFVYLATDIEQQKIAHFLDHETAKIDTLIDKQEKLIELLKEKRQAVISHAVTKGISYKGQPNAPMKDSGVEWLGEVPEHWVKIAFKKVIKTRKGVAFSTSDFCDNGVRVVKASDIKLLSLRQSDVFLPINFIKKYPKAYLTQGNIILSTVGSSPDVKNSAVGQIAMVPKELDNTLLNQNTVVFEPIDKKIDRDYLFFLLQTTAYRDHLDLHAHGTANQASLNVADMLNFKCFTPPLNEQKHIAVHLYKFLEIVSTLETRVINAIQLMQERKTALISAAVTGNIDVRDWTASGEV